MAPTAEFRPAQPGKSRESAPLDGTDESYYTNSIYAGERGRAMIENARLALPPRLAAVAALVEQYYLAGVEISLTIILFIYFRYTSARRKKAILNYIQNTADTQLPPLRL